MPIDFPRSVRFRIAGALCIVLTGAAGSACSGPEFVAVPPAPEPAGAAAPQAESSRCRRRPRRLPPPAFPMGWEWRSSGFPRATS